MLQKSRNEPSREYKKSDKGFYFSPERRRLREQLRKRTTTATQSEEKKKEVTINKGPVYSCPLSHQNFRGPCAIMQCNFNITKYKQAESCCLIIQSGGKDSFDKWDLQRSLGIAESKLYKLKDQGNRKSACILMLNKILDLVREIPHPDIFIEKIDQISNFISNSHLSLKELNVKAIDVIQIKNNMSKIEDFIEQSGQTFTLAEILGTDKPIP